MPCGANSCLWDVVLRLRGARQLPSHLADDEHGGRAAGSQSVTANAVQGARIEDEAERLAAWLSSFSPAEDEAGRLAVWVSSFSPADSKPAAAQASGAKVTPESVLPKPNEDPGLLREGTQWKRADRWHNEEAPSCRGPYRGSIVRRETIEEKRIKQWLTNFSQPSSAVGNLESSPLQIAEDDAAVPVLAAFVTRSLIATAQVSVACHETSQAAMLIADQKRATTYLRQAQAALTAENDQLRADLQRENNQLREDVKRMHDDIAALHAARSRVGTPSKDTISPLVSLNGNLTDQSMGALLCESRLDASTSIELGHGSPIEKATSDRGASPSEDKYRVGHGEASQPFPIIAREVKSVSYKHGEPKGADRRESFTLEKARGVSPLRTKVDRACIAKAFMGASAGVDQGEEPAAAGRTRDGSPPALRRSSSTDGLTRRRPVAPASAKRRTSSSDRLQSSSAPSTAPQVRSVARTASPSKSPEANRSVLDIEAPQKVGTRAPISSALGARRTPMAPLPVRGGRLRTSAGTGTDRSPGSAPASDGSFPSSSAAVYSAGADVSPSPQRGSTPTRPGMRRVSSAERFSRRAPLNLNVRQAPVLTPLRGEPQQAMSSDPERGVVEYLRYGGWQEMWGSNEAPPKTRGAAEPWRPLRQPETKPRRLLTAVARS